MRCRACSMTPPANAPPKSPICCAPARTRGGATGRPRRRPMQRAVAAADADAAATGQDAVVLLSRACASFDQFADFEARGEAFRDAVQSLAVPKPAAGARA